MYAERGIESGRREYAESLNYAEIIGRNYLVLIFSIEKEGYKQYCEYS